MILISDLGAQPTAVGDVDAVSLRPCPTCEAGTGTTRPVEAADDVAAESVAESLITVAAAYEIAAEATSQAGARVRAASITMAEAQVLRYLPAPLPFSVIAGKLGISRSAAKERTARLYNRLGVDRRGRGGVHRVADQAARPRHELADVLIYVTRLAQMTGIDLIGEVERELARNAAREYRRDDRGVLRRVAGPDKRQRRLASATTARTKATLRAQRYRLGQVGGAD